MRRDHYEVLGVAPTSEDVVIRAAYRALMRRYHPDTGPAAEMSGRALEINAAYAVLGDPAKRARYDGSLAAAGLIKPQAEQRRGLAMPSVPRPSPTAAAAFVTVGGLALILALSPPVAQMPGVPVVLGDSARPPDAVSSPPSPAEVEPPPATVEVATPPATAVEVAPRAAAPVVESDEPPPAAVVVPAPPRQRAKAPDAAPARKVAANAPAKAPAKAPARAPSGCRYATSRSADAICGSTNLAALDRSQEQFYGQSLGRADDARKARLVSSNAAFERKRDACRSQSCLTAAYLARLREVSVIMAKGAQPK